MSMSVESPVGRFSLLVSPGASSNVQPVRLCREEADISRLGLRASGPEEWENGLRTDGGWDSFEWWYTDASFLDGTRIELAFLTKERIDVESLACPTVRLELTLPSGERVEEVCHGTRGELLKASSETTDIQIGESYLKREGDVYRLRFAGEFVQYEATFASLVPAWRPGTGQWVFGEHEEKQFNWLVAQPLATVEAELVYGGETRSLEGRGYQDHNWGNAPMHKLLNQWYWGRVNVGDTTAIVVEMVAEKEYGYKRLPLVFLAEEGCILEGDATRVHAREIDARQHPFTRKLVAERLCFERTVADGRTFSFSFSRKEDVKQASLLARLPFWQRLAARWMGANPTFLRMAGDIRCQITKDGQIDTHELDGTWEQMFFGNNNHLVEERV